MIAFAVALLVAHVAAAAPADDLEARGQQLAKEGRYSDAIDAFKAAEREQPRARHACLIALAYSRRELWPQAELFLQQCHARGSAQDPLPDWVSAEDAQIAERLAAANVALVTIKIEPDVPAAITVSSFQLDEQLTQHKAHLPFGHHVLRATAPGYAPTNVDIDITTRENRTISIALVRPARPVAVQPRSRTPWIVMGVGVALALGGAATDLFWAQPLRDDLRHDQDITTYNSHASGLTTARWTTYGLWGVGAIGVVAGVVLRYRDVSIEPTPGGAMISMRWSR